MRPCGGRFLALDQIFTRALFDCGRGCFVESSPSACGRALARKSPLPLAGGVGGGHRRCAPCGVIGRTCRTVAPRTPLRRNLRHLSLCRVDRPGIMVLLLRRSLRLGLLGLFGRRDRAVGGQQYARCPQQRAPAAAKYVLTVPEHRAALAPDRLMRRMRRWIGMGWVLEYSPLPLTEGAGGGPRWTQPVPE